MGLFKRLLWHLFARMVYQDDIPREGDLAPRTCVLCDKRSVEHRALRDPYADSRVCWEATREHSAPCGLRCANGVATERRMIDLKCPPQFRTLHTKTFCPKCTKTLFVQPD